MAGQNALQQRRAGTRLGDKKDQSFTVRSNAHRATRRPRAGNDSPIEVMLVAEFDQYLARQLFEQTLMLWRQALTPSTNLSFSKRMSSSE
jgi:hypothetical protein